MYATEAGKRRRIIMDGTEVTTCHWEFTAVDQNEKEKK